MNPKRLLFPALVVLCALCAALPGCQKKATKIQEGPQTPKIPETVKPPPPLMMDTTDAAFKGYSVK